MEKPKTPKKNKGEYPPVPPRNEIPMYDPQTGEANPYYEELTGKKNPLLEARKNGIPVLVEPKRKNRWTVNFPEHFGIEPFVFQKTQRPHVSIVPKKFLGFKIGNRLDWGRITFEILDPIGPSTSDKLANIIENHINEEFDYTLEMLDPTGAVVEKWLISGCKIEAISFGALDYSNDDIVRCFMSIKPTNVKLE